MRIQHNIAAMNSYRNFSTNNSQLSKNLEKLSSGYKINRAGDDAAGLAISEKMRAQLTGIEGAQKNSKDGISLIQTAEGALTEVHSMLNRMSSLAEQSANGTYDTEVDRAQLQKEVDSLVNEIDRISKSTNFNGIKLLDGTLGGRVAAEDQVTATANGIQSIQVYGGGKYETAGGTLSSSLSKGIKAELTATGTITLSHSAAVSGISWVRIGGSDSTGKVGVNGGAVTFKAVSTDTAAKSQNAKLYEGMTVTVTVDKAKPATAGGTRSFATSAKTLAAASVKGSTGLQLQVGETADSFNQMKVVVRDMSAAGIGVDGVSIATQEGAAAALDTIKNAINTVSDQRGDLGALQNRLDHTINNLGVMQENIQSAESAIRDTDVAEEMMKYTKNNILNQSAQAMLAQANQMPQGVLQLLQ